MKSAVLISALAAVAVAQPRHHHNNRHVRNLEALHAAEAKRDGGRVHTTTSWVTHFVTVTELIGASTTDYYTNNLPTAAEAPTSSPDGQFYESKHVVSYSTTSESVPTFSLPADDDVETIVSESEYTTPAIVKPTTVISVVVPTTTEEIVIPTPTKEIVIPTPTKETVAPVIPKPTVEYPSPDPVPSSAPALSGDVTYYDIGMGACGIDNAGEDLAINIVALSGSLMGEKSNDNPNCGRTITIKANGRTTTALVTDKCMGCNYNSIDVSKKAFLELWDSYDVGRGPCEWWWND